MKYNANPVVPPYSTVSSDKTQ